MNMKDFEKLHIEPSRALLMFGKAMEHRMRLKVLLELKGQKHTNIDIKPEDAENLPAL
jgi:hypothetical protein